MQPRRGLPPAPSSLPAPPHLPQIAGNNGLLRSNVAIPSQGALTAQAVTAALSNPYSQTYHSGHSSHYAQAYMQHNTNVNLWPNTNSNVEGYTLSSTYVHSLPGPSSASRSTEPNSRGESSGHTGRNINQTTYPHSNMPQGSWYQFGNSRCTYKDCSFSGSQKALEIHRMDRHLIYPPGWDNRKKQSDWDADPSLKGKPITIQGTTVNLDDPEVLDAWIAERKRRWPSTDRVEDKKRKLHEAIARGQISVDDPAMLRGKRRKLDGNSRESYSSHDNTNEGGRGRGRGRARGRGRGTDGGWRGRGRGGSAIQSRELTGSQMMTTTPSLPKEPEVTSQGASVDSNSDDDAPPEIITSKPPPGLVEHEPTADDDAEKQSPASESKDLKPNITTLSPFSTTAKKPRSIQPKKPPHNPFASRPTLLRNLLLPEIRATVSNFSQAIRFLVDNDFLEGVELRPGEANEKLIEEVGNSDTPVTI